MDPLSVSAFSNALAAVPAFRQEFAQRIKTFIGGSDEPAYQLECVFETKLTQFSKIGARASYYLY